MWEVHCKPGDAVKKGQPLLVLEAMKMEYPVAAPADGKIVEVHVESNSLTHQGDVLLTVAAARATTPEE